MNRAGWHWGRLDVDLFKVDSGKYKILSELGRGGMGVVYLAEDSLLKRKVALKVLYEHLCRESEFVERFHEEARSVSTLHHPNIVCVHGLERSANVYLIDMEYVDGLSLDKFAESAHLTPPLIARLGGEILEGLVACHGIGIVHRDIKPSNILIDQHGAAKITDFGLATAYANHLRSSITSGNSGGYFMGTPRYAPPAAWDGHNPTPDWDLYSLGIILFELLSGRVAFAGQTPMAIVRQHLTTKLPRLREIKPELSEALTDLVDRLLKADRVSAPITSLEARSALWQTPEFAAVEVSDQAETISIAVRRRALRRNARKLGPWLYRGLAATIIVAATATCIWWLGGSLTESPSAISSLREPVAFLRPQAISSDGGGEALWMLSNSEDGNPEGIVALNALGMWRLALAPASESGRYTVSGHWAEYMRPAAGAFRFGTVEGIALIEQEEGRITLSVERLNDRDGTREPINVVAKPTTTPYDRPAFVIAMESNEVVQSLLYNELLKRDLAWAGELEALMPSFPAGRIVVPQAATDITIDGALDEAVWKKSHVADGKRMGEALNGRATLFVRWSPEAVVIGVDGGAVPAGAQLEIALLPGVEVSLNNSQRFFAAVDTGGIKQTRSTAGPLELPWDCNWSGAATYREGRLQAELRIPTEQFTELAIPEAGRRWRLNAALNGPDGGPSLVHWGFDDQARPEHGALIIFGGPGK